MRIVVALGGNAILPRGERGTIAEQRSSIRDASDGLAAVIAGGHEIVITHGNGPQIGRMMFQDEALPERFPRFPLDVHVAETQGQLGYLIQQELAAALRRERAPHTVVTVVTQVVVDPGDPAFLMPTKPVGPFLDEEHAAELRARGEAVRQIPAGGWRRLVPSPMALEIVEVDAVRALLEAGAVPIAAGGGGIPVVPEGNAYRGIAAVVDKDLAASILTTALQADMLLILTDVDHVVRHFGMPDAEPIVRMTVREARAGIDAGDFPPGSMGPKVLAAAQAAEHGARAVIASIGAIEDAVAGRDGTEIVR